MSRAVIMIVVVIVSLILWGRVGWLLACKIADATFWRVIIAIPLIAITVKLGMVIAMLVQRPRNK